MLWDLFVLFLILAFAYAFAFPNDVPPVVTKRSLMFFLISLVVLNVFQIISYIGRVITHILLGG